jgi:hypothetical protein
MKLNKLCNLDQSEYYLNQKKLPYMLYWIYPKSNIYICNYRFFKEKNLYRFMAYDLCF